jgi:hypothetical protein
METYRNGVNVLAGWDSIYLMQWGVRGGGRKGRGLRSRRGWREKEISWESYHTYFMNKCPNLRKWKYFVGNRRNKVTEKG